MSTINERIKKIVNELYDGNVSEFERCIGIKPYTIKNIVGSRQTKPSYDILEAINRNNVQLSSDWLLTGEGPMLRNNTSELEPDKNMLSNSNSGLSVNYKLVPLINIDAVGGMHKGNAIMNEPEYIVKMIAFNDAQENDKCIQVTGHSMEPACPPGSIVLIREVARWREFFGFGNIFVLLLSDGRRIIKRIIQSEIDPRNYVRCVSINPDYPDEDLPKDMIVGVWKVIKILVDRGW